MGLLIRWGRLPRAPKNAFAAWRFCGFGHFFRKNTDSTSVSAKLTCIWVPDRILFADVISSSAGCWRTRRPIPGVALISDM